MNLGIFKAYDVRGRLDSDITHNDALLIGQALAMWLPKGGPVAVGYDMRPESNQLAQNLIKGILQQGRDVWQIGQVTTDMVYFAVGKYELAGGVMVSGSATGELSVMKFCHEQAKPIGIDNGFMEMRDLVARNQFVAPTTKGKATQKNIVDDWLEHALGFVTIGKWPRFKVAIDAGNGMAGVVLPKLQTKIPFSIFALNDTPDATFPHHRANPLDSKNLVELQEYIHAQKIDVGIAFDADGDRAVLLDEHGNPLSGTVLTAILAKYMLKKYPGAAILYNLICGQVVKRTIEENGGKPFRTKVGYSYIKADMRARKGVFAGEHSGAYYFRDNFYTDSGLIAALLALQIMAETGQPLSKLANEYRDAFVSIPETNFKVQDRMGALAAVRSVFKEGEQDLLDGLTVTFSNKWFNVRPSNTEPLMRLNAEAASKADLDDLVGQVKKVLEPFIST